MTKKHFPKGLDDRMRDKDGEIRRKRSDTLVGTLRGEYGRGFVWVIDPMQNSEPS